MCDKNVVWIEKDFSDLFSAVSIVVGGIPTYRRFQCVGCQTRVEDKHASQPMWDECYCESPLHQMCLKCLKEEFKDKKYLDATCPSIKGWAIFDEMSKYGASPKRTRR